MRTLNSVSEFQTEAANAVFTKQQAISATLQLLTKEWNDPGNTPEEKSVLENAIQRAEFDEVGDGPYAGRYWRGALYYAGYRKRHSGDRIRCGVSPNLRNIIPAGQSPAGRRGFLHARKAVDSKGLLILPFLSYNKDNALKK